MKIIIIGWSQIDSTNGKAFALHIDNPCVIDSPVYGHLSMTKSDFCEQMGVNKFRRGITMKVKMNWKQKG